MVTAAADVIAGFGIGLFFHGGASWPLPLLLPLLLSTLCLYAGGITLNDVFDLELDRQERPERPLPAGAIPFNVALYAGITFLLAGVMFAACSGWLSALTAAVVAFLAVTYDAVTKSHPLWGPLTMGSCRAGNLLLGASAFGSLSVLWPVGLVPLVFIAAVTLVSRGEVSGGGRLSLLLAGLGYLLIVTVLSGSALYLGELSWLSFIFVLLFVGVVFPPLIQAFQNPQPALIGNAVKWGVLGLIPMNAAWGCIFQGWPYGLIILALLPISAGLARLYAVT